MAGGVPMTLEGNAKVATVEAGAMGTDDDGAAKPQEIARGPVAAIVAIKQLGTNGGGFFGANSAHPFENPNSWTNFLTCVCIILFPFASLVMFGRMLSNMRHAAVIFGVMLVLSAATIVWAVYYDSMQPNPALTGARRTQTLRRFRTRAGEGGERDRDAARASPGLPVDQALGNLEGKELRFGTSAGPTWAAFTTITSNGSVNCMHDSLNPLAGLTPLTGMWLNCIFGGVGVGLINLLIYLIVGVFLAGLMVGRTPEYLGKKVEAREMKLAMLALLIHPLMILGPTGLFAAPDWGTKATNNPGAHGFSEILYEFSSASANNGSGFEGLADTYGFNDRRQRSPPAPYSAALGHRLRAGDADQPLHPDHRPAGVRRQPGGEEADAVHGRDAAHRHGHVRLRAAGDDPAGRRPAVPAGRGAGPGGRAPGPMPFGGGSRRQSPKIQTNGLKTAYRNENSHDDNRSS